MGDNPPGPYPGNRRRRFRSEMKDDRNEIPVAGPHVDATEQAIDRLLAGEASAFPLAGRVADALSREVSSPASTAHLAAIERAAAAPGVPSAIPLRSRRRGRRALVAALAAMFLFTIGSSGAVAAAQGAAPGDPLYGLKRASERWRLSVTTSPEAKAALHLQWADRRLAEIQKLAAKGRNPSSLHRDYSTEVRRAERLAERAQDRGVDVAALLSDILARLGKHVDRLNQVLSDAPEAAHKGLENAIDNAQKAQERVRDARGHGGDGQQNNGNGKPTDTGRPSDPGKPSTPPSERGKGKSPRSSTGSK